MRAVVADVIITVEDCPSKDISNDPHLLGLFVGVPRGRRSVFDSARPPDRIYLFQRNIEDSAHTRMQMIAEIRTTLWHEVGHYLGFGEADLEDLGLG